MNTGRKIFNTIFGPVCAAGVLFYTYDSNKEFRILIQRRENRIEDLGGKVDRKDIDIYDTAIREVYEETNKKISLSRKRLMSSKYMYLQMGKYMLFIVYATKREFSITDFSDHEVCDYAIDALASSLCIKKREISWESISNLKDQEFNSRINLEVIEKIRSVC